MAASIQPRPGGKHQLRVVHKLLPKDFFFTFAGEDSLKQAENYRDRLVSMLQQGIVPAALLATPAKGEDPLLVEVISGYEKASTPTPSDLEQLRLIRLDAGGLRASELTYEWVEDWVRGMKLTKNLAPGTIRKYVGTLARAYDWHLKKGAGADQTPRANPLRLLPRGYSQYTEAEERLLQRAGKEARVDEERDRRLLAEEEERVRAALAGVKRPDRERALTPDPDLRVMFDLILDTGLRLSEAYKLRVEQLDFVRGVIRLEGSKAARGRRKPRVVPLKKHLRTLLQAHCGTRKSGLVFRFWDGVEDTGKVSTRLSVRFGTLFKYAGVEDFTEHDLRHEATCRWFELRTPTGGWTFSDIEICKIMGWTSTKMALRYASLRGEDLADRLL
jgi:integrase